jgi:hypothetical protein
MKRIRRLKPSAGLSLVLLGLLSSVLMIAPATAAPVAFSFTGVVTNVQPSLNPPFTTATLLTGSYTFEDSTGDSRPGYSNRGLYYGAITALDVNLGLYTATLGNSGNNFIDIRNLSVDQYDLQAPLFGSPVVPPGLPVNKFSPLRFRIELRDPNSGLVSDDLFSGRARVQGNLTTLTAVPLPTAVILFGTGLVALVGLGAGSWRQKKNSLA